jgi:hypothetical protein
VRDYYSSGTKQVTGSKLDQVVERHRKATQDRIVELLREASGEGLGNDASAWIDRFAHSQHGSSFAEAK